MLRTHKFPLSEMRLVKHADPARAPTAIGQVVMLNSGGKHMLVVDLLDEDHVKCAWQDDAGEAHEAPFPRVCLSRV